MLVQAIGRNEPEEPVCEFKMSIEIAVQKI
jgi:hypothetical protein